jgi:peptidoglycan/xylan/chitin deacetylase (PgdA/CDA1 family)
MTDHRQLDDVPFPAPGCEGGCVLRVLTYHRVREPLDTPRLDPTLVSATPERFAWQMKHLARWYRPVPLAAVAAAFTGGAPLPPRAVHVTFDDAYRDFGEVAWPILRDLGIPVTLFVPTAYPGDHQRYLWWDRVHRAVALTGLGAPGGVPGPTVAREIRSLLRELPHDDAEMLVSRWFASGAELDGADDERAMLDWSELRALHAQGVTLGAHTRHHVPLTRVPQGRVREELRESLRDLRREIGDVLPTLSYPYGMHDDRVVRVAREEGFTLGFTCDDGLSRPGGVDPLRLRRTNITQRTTPPLFAARMLPWFGHIDRWRPRRARARLRE